MSRTKRNQARTIRLGYNLAKNKNKDGTVRDGTPTHHGASCSRGGSCEYCARNRQFDKIKTDVHSRGDLGEVYINTESPHGGGETVEKELGESIKEVEQQNYA